MALSNIKRRERIKLGIRKKISGTPERPRLSVFRSNKYIYAQLIDDVNGHTLAAASSRDAGVAGGTKSEEAAKVGQLLAEKAKSSNIESVVFDRAGYRYHGRVKALADGARNNGLKF
jgi:large subunit ribosomal protein L18